MGDIILFLISLCISVIIVFLLYRAVKKSSSMAEKITEILLSFVILILLLIYYLDRYNIPSVLNFNMNINTQNWLSLVGNYATGIVSAIIGALVAVWTTIYQIKKNNEENERRDKENLRIQNMPIIKYEINTERGGDGDLSELIITNVELQTGNVYYLNIIFKNIGMNSIRSIIIDFKSPVINNSIYRLLGKNDLTPVEKSEEIEINRFFGLKPSNDAYEMHLDIYFQDVLSNWYKQEIEMHYFASNRYKDGRPIGSIYYEVKKENVIIEDEIEKKIL